MNTNFSTKVKRDLLRVGISNYAIRRAEARHLAGVLNENEEIYAAVFGRTKQGAALLVATSQRIIYFRKTPLASTVDDISYEVVSGFMLAQAMGMLATITLRTRTGDYTLSYVNLRSARIFKQYIEQNRISGEAHPPQSSKPAAFGITHEPVMSGNVITKQAVQFLLEHELGVISTLGHSSIPSGAVVYYVFNETLQTFNILTKNETTKAKNILTNHAVAFTIFDESTMQTVQMQASAEKEPDAQIRQQAYEKISQPHKINPADAPPVTSIEKGEFTVLRLTPQSFEYRDYKAKL